MSSIAAAIARDEPAKVPQPSKPLLWLALGLVLAGFLGWAALLGVLDMELGYEPLLAGGIGGIALVASGLLAGAWAWRRWRLDIVEQQAEGAQLNNFHTVMSLTNRLILRRPDPRELFEGVCEACVKAGHVDLAVIDMPSTNEAHRVAADALAGIVVGASPALLLDAVRVRHLMLQFVRHAGKPVFIDDAATDARLREASEWCSKTGLRSLAVIPVCRGGVLSGILLLSSQTKSFFGPQLAPLLSELGADLSFALDNAALEAERKKAVFADAERVLAEDANRAKTEFLAKMSHELRTPLNAMLGFAQLLATDSDDVLTQTQAERVRLISHAGWHLLGLVNDVMDISLIESRRFGVDIVGGDVSSVLDEAVALMQPIARTHHVVLAALPASRFGVGVLADPRRLLQVLLNLLSNACKYNSSGGQVKIEVNHLGHEVALEVVDDGVGMSEEQLAHLFEPFNRLGNADLTIEGVGLGLALSRQLLVLMNGRLEIESTLGKGTCARVVLPACAIPLRESGSQSAAPRVEPRAAPRAVPGQTPPRTSDALVLYIEDDQVNQILVEQMLLRCDGVALILAANGKDGIALARSRKPDLVMLDLQLPDMTGFDVLAALRADPQTEALRVVVLSANSTPTDIANAKNLGVIDYWQKPLRLESLVSGIARVLGRPTAVGIDGHSGPNVPNGAAVVGEIHLPAPGEVSAANGHDPRPHSGSSGL